jgi:hypothetical protein
MGIVQIISFIQTPPVYMGKTGINLSLFSKIVPFPPELNAVAGGQA